MRITIPELMLQVAALLALRATCPKLSVGCVLTDSRGRIVGTGYNGVPRNFRHCTEEPCAGANTPPGADLCLAVHAEQNALLQCKDPDKIYAAYITHSPCMRCVKTLMNTGCQHIYYSNVVDKEPLAFWRSTGRYADYWT